MPKTAKIAVKLVAAGAAVAAVAALSGCASLLRGPYERIAVTSAPEGALCRIYREGQGFVKAIATPGVKYVMRDHKPITIECSKEGYQTTTVDYDTFRGEQDNIGNFGSAGAGFAVDLANSTQDQLPDQVHIVLPRLQ